MEANNSIVTEELATCNADQINYNDFDDWDTIYAVRSAREQKRAQLQRILLERFTNEEMTEEEFYSNYQRIQDHFQDLWFIMPMNFNAVLSHVYEVRERRRNQQNAQQTQQAQDTESDPEV